MGHELSPDTRLEATDHVICRTVDEEAVILDLDTGTYFGLDDVGRRVWDLMESDGRLSAIVAGVLAEYEVEEDVLWNDIRALLSAMLEKNLVAVVE